MTHCVCRAAQWAILGWARESNGGRAGGRGAGAKVGKCKGVTKAASRQTCRAAQNTAEWRAGCLRTESRTARHRIGMSLNATSSLLSASRTVQRCATQPALTSPPLLHRNCVPPSVMCKVAPHTPVCDIPSGCCSFMGPWLGLGPVLPFVCCVGSLLSVGRCSC